MVQTAPSPIGGNGQRDTNGRFVKGNSGGPGNPHGREVAQIRSMIHSAVTEADLREVLAALVTKAKEGDVPAAHELLNRLGGKPFTGMDPTKVELEERRLTLAEDRLEEECIWKM